MKNISTGTGIALLAGAILGSTIIMRFGPVDQAAHAAPPIEAVKAIVGSSTAQVAPTIVWYGTSGFSASAWNIGVILRSWSDGRVEMKRILGTNDPCAEALPCNTAWIVISDPNSGYNASADITFDSKVDGADLGQVLAMWGDAPRQDIPPSTCPLNLINP